MREINDIKFRAWSKKNNKMFGLFSIYDGHIDVDGAVDEDGAVTLWAGEYELLQYTGLKDKNGKEIYEGDILIAESTGENLGVVEMLNGCWVVNYEKGTGNYIYKLSDRANIDKIIGDIYSTPDLLKGTEK